MSMIAIHPGEHLAEELKELDLSASELARKLDVPPNRITGILDGQRAITGDTALRLAHFSAQALNSGLTCKTFTNCVSPNRKLERRSARFLGLNASNKMLPEAANASLQFGQSWRRLFPG